MPLTHAPHSVLLYLNSHATLSAGPTPLERSSALDRVLNDIRHLSTTIQEIWKGPVQPEENIWYSDRIYYFQRSLYEIIHRPASDSQDLEIPGAIAALIYCCNCLRDTPLNFRVIFKAVTRLKESLQPVSRSVMLSQYSGFHFKLFWILGLGGAASEGKPERTWLVEEFRIVRDILEVQSWEETRSILEGMLWHPALDRCGKRFWDEVISQSPSEIGTRQI